MDDQGPVEFGGDPLNPTDAPVRVRRRGKSARRSAWRVMCSATTGAFITGSGFLIGGNVTLSIA